MARKSSLDSKEKIGSVTLKRLGANRFQLAWRDSETGSYVRRRIDATPEEAKRAAAHVSAQVLSGRGFLPGRKAATPNLREAFEDSIRLSGGNPETRKDLAKRAALFVRWIEERFPRVREWADLRPSMIREYLRTLEAEGYAFDTIRLRLVPVKSAWRYVAENYPGAVHPLPRIKQAPPGPREIVCLEPEEVSVLLAWLRENHPSLGTVAALQSLAGLRLREATYLRRQDIDLAKAAVAVTETPLHKPKNRTSFRTVPVCGEVLGALEEAMNRQRIIPSSGELFLTAHGNPWTTDILSARLREILDAASRETELPRLREIPFRKLRSAFATIATRLNVPDAALRKYLGHAGSGILERHYQRIGEEELRTVSGAMEAWRTLIPGGENCKIIATQKSEAL